MLLFVRYPRREGLPGTLAAEIESCERAAAGVRTLHLDYPARPVIRQATRAGAGAGGRRRSWLREFAAEAHDGREVPDVGLLVRNGGEQRLSDFLLWECAYPPLRLPFPGGGESTGLLGGGSRQVWWAPADRHAPDAFDAPASNRSRPPDAPPSAGSAAFLPSGEGSRGRARTAAGFRACQ